MTASSTVNSLIGLRYQWGAKPSDGKGFSDCFFLSMEARRALGLPSWEERFQWVYEREFDHQKDRRKVLRECLALGTKTSSPSIGDIILFKADAVGLATITNSGLLFIPRDGLSQIASLSQFAPGSYYCFHHKP